MPTAPDPNAPLTFSTDDARRDARELGIDLRYQDWRNVFLAITDTMANDGQRSNVAHTIAAFVGHVRDGAERWAITCRGVAFHALYDPRRASIFRVLPPRRAGAMPARPRAPLVDATA